MPAWPFPPPLKPMLAKVKTDFPARGEWAFEPKWDGFRALAWSEEPRLDSRNERPLLRYFPELTGALAALPAGTVVDGEIVVVAGDRTSFDSLQLRIHPAESRIDLLAAEIPAEIVAFDLLAHQGDDLRERPFRERRERLADLMSGLEQPWHLSPSTTDAAVARRWFTEYEAAGCDGLIAKDMDGRYVPDKREMIKLKHRRDADCVVGGYRIHKEGDRLGSLLLGLYNDEGQLHFIGHCSGFSNHDRVELLKRFEALRSDESFGEEARRPGTPSRWSSGKDMEWIPVQPGVVVQVSYDQLTEGRFRHATRFERWRPDKDPADCTFDQLERPDGVGFSEVIG